MVWAGEAAQFPRQKRERVVETLGWQTQLCLPLRWEVPSAFGCLPVLEPLADLSFNEHMNISVMVLVRWSVPQTRFSLLGSTLALGDESHPGSGKRQRSFLQFGTDASILVYI